MKKQLILLVLLGVVSIAYAIPPGENRCIDPTQSIPEPAGYCNNTSTEPGEVLFECDYGPAAPGQEMTCIGNSPIPNLY